MTGATQEEQAAAAVIAAAQAIIERIRERPYPSMRPPAVLNESAPIRALWDAVTAYNRLRAEREAPREL